MANSIEIRDVVKTYRIYDRPYDRMKEVLLPGGKRYHREFSALKGVSLDVSRGETIGIIGRNGSGKSTLLKIICGVLTPSSGMVKTNGRISALLELGTGFNPEFTGRENAYFSGTLMGFTESEMDERVEAIMDFADIGEFFDQPVTKYSSGMYVRLAFACAINVDPEILIIDEALAVGDIFFQQKCYRRISEFKNSGKTIILVTHSLDAIQKHCDRAVMLDAGEVVAEGDPKRVTNRYLEMLTSADRKGAKGGFPYEREGMPEDKCPSHKSYNPNEYRYGSGDAVITGFGIYDTSGEPLTAVQSKDEFVFRYEVRFLKPVNKPIYGFAVKTSDGLTVYGTNTMFEEAGVEPREAGDAVVVEFTQKAGIVSGDYFLTAGVAELAGDEALPLDRRYDLAHLHVIPLGRPFGIANLMSRVRVVKGGLSGTGE